MNSLGSALRADLAGQIIPTIRGVRVTSKNELAPTTEALARGTAFTQNRGHSLDQRQLLGSWPALQLLLTAYCPARIGGAFKPHEPIAVVRRSESLIQL